MIGANPIRHGPWEVRELRRAWRARLATDLQAPQELDVDIEGDIVVQGDAFQAHHRHNDPGDLHCLVVHRGLPAPPSGAWLDERIIGRDLRVRVRRHGRDGAYVAMIRSATVIGSDAEREASYLHLHAQHRIGLAALSLQSRVFAAASFRRVVDEVLDGYGLELRWSLLQEVPEDALTIQYQESDLEFAGRLLAEHGVFWCPDPEDSRRVMLADHPEGLPRVETLLTSNAAGGLRDAKAFYLDDLQASRSLGPVRASTLGYDPMRAALRPPGTNPLAAMPLQRTFAHHANGLHYASTATEDAAQTTAREMYRHDGRRATDQNATSAQLARDRGQTQRWSAATTVPGLAAGTCIDLTFDPAGHGPLAVTDVVHAFVPEALGGAGEYEGSVALVPRASPLAATPTPWPAMDRVELGVVVGPPGQTLHTNESGEVRVQFHWDRQNRYDDRSSCWMRVVQPWSGPGYGMQFIPRVGTEVLVAFGGGNPNHPVVVACLHNTANPLPTSPESFPALSTIRSRSLEGGGANEIVFDDTPGGEQLRLRGEQDCLINAARHVVQQAGNSMRVDVGTDHDTQVGGDQTVSVAGAAAIAYGRLTTNIGGDATYTCAGDLKERVAGFHLRDITGGKLETVRGFARVAVVPASEAEPGDLELTAAGTTRAAGRRLHLQATDQITLQVGATTLTLDRQRIELRSNEIHLNSVEGTKIYIDDDEALSVAEGFQVSRGNVVISSGGASLRLDADAHLDGALVKLNCGPGSAGGDVASQDPDDQALAVFDLELPPGVTTATFVIVHPTGEVKHHEAPAGHLELPGPRGATFVLQEVLIDGITHAIISPTKDTSE
ncbi:MAG: type VI secretion system tip protein TssI/VgrG [Myxococcota bacterium]